MKMLCAIPVFQVNDLEVSLRYYKDVLGFEEAFKLPDYAGVSFDEISIQLCGHHIHKRPVGGGAVCVFCNDVDAYFAKLKSRGAIIKVEAADRPYGMKDFTVADPDDNRLTFGCEIGKT